MGTSNSVTELVAKFSTAARGMGEANRKAVGEAALVYKESVLDEGKRDSGGDLRLSRGGARRNGVPKGIKLNARYDVKGMDNAVALLKAVPEGPWKWLGNGTRPHEIPKQGGRRRRKKAIRFPDGSVRRGPVQHPGTKGKGTWSRGITKAQPGAMRTYAATHRRALVDVFGGS